MDLPTYADVLQAAPLVHRYLKPTPLYEWHRGQTLVGRAAVPAMALMREAKRVLKPWLKPETGRHTTTTASKKQAKTS